LPTHGAGGATCADGKPWRDQWQSALWAASTGQAAWLLWDELTPREKWLAARMVCDEADRFVTQTPPSQVKRDTKAEENAWNSRVVALAFNMFPNHPNHDRYREAAVRWQLSSFTTAADLTREDLVEGKPLKQWLSGVGANLHDDYTLENHDRVHPDYMASIRTLVTQSLLYEWAKQRRAGVAADEREERLREPEEARVARRRVPLSERPGLAAPSQRRLVRPSRRHGDPLRTTRRPRG
jgi:hypothetical protein